MARCGARVGDCIGTWGIGIGVDRTVGRDGGGRKLNNLGMEYSRRSDARRSDGVDMGSVGIAKKAFMQSKISRGGSGGKGGVVMRECRVDTTWMDVRLVVFGK